VDRDFLINLYFKGARRGIKLFLSPILNLTAINFLFFSKANLRLEDENKAISNTPMEYHTINGPERSVH
jgi:hypothetical protein